MALKRMFVTYPEAVEMLGGDREAVRQAFFMHELTAFIELHHTRARSKSLPPDIGDGERADHHIGSYVRDGQGFTKASRWFREQAEDTADSYSFSLNGWYWISPYDAEIWITRGFLACPPFLWPSSADPEPYYPPVSLDGWLQLTSIEPLNQMHSYEKLVWLSFQQIETLAKREEEGERPEASAPKSSKIRSDREETLLRSIAGMWELSGLPKEPATAADKLSALFDSWSWEKPGKKTIADTVLTPAARLRQTKS